MSKVISHSAPPPEVYQALRYGFVDEDKKTVCLFSAVNRQFRSVALAIGKDRLIRFTATLQKRCAPDLSKQVKLLKKDIAQRTYPSFQSLHNASRELAITLPSFAPENYLSLPSPCFGENFFIAAFQPSDTEKSNSALLNLTMRYILSEDWKWANQALDSINPSPSDRPFNDEGWSKYTTLNELALRLQETKNLLKLEKVIEQLIPREDNFEDISREFLKQLFTHWLKAKDYVSAERVALLTRSVLSNSTHSTSPPLQYLFSKGWWKEDRLRGDDYLRKIAHEFAGENNFPEALRIANRVDDRLKSKVILEIAEIAIAFGHLDAAQDILVTLPEESDDYGEVALKFFESLGHHDEVNPSPFIAHLSAHFSPSFLLNLACFLSGEGSPKEAKMVAELLPEDIPGVEHFKEMKAALLL